MGQGQQCQEIRSQPKTTISLPHSKSKVNEALSPKGWAEECREFQQAFSGLRYERSWIYGGNHCIARVKLLDNNTLY